MELRADPHGVGVDQLLADVGALVLPIAANRMNRVFSDFGDQVFRLLNGKILGRLVLRKVTSSLVQVVQAEPALGILADGDAGDGEGAVLPFMARCGRLFVECMLRASGQQACCAPEQLS